MSVLAAAPKQEGGVNLPSRLEQGPVTPISDVATRQLRVENLERDMPLYRSCNLWLPAELWSILLSMTVIMEGYFNLLLPQFFAMSVFCQQFGVMGPKGIYEIPTQWQSGLSVVGLVGEIIGLCTSAIAVERLGYRKTMIASLLTLVAFNNILFFSQNLWMILIGEILCGIPFGVFQTLACIYASDVCPMKLRPFLTTYTNMCWLIGQLLSSGVMRMLVGSTNQWVVLLVGWSRPKGGYEEGFDSTDQIKLCTT